MASITHFKGNLSPSLSDTLRVDGVAFDLTGASVKLQARFQQTPTTLKIDAAATVITTSTTLSGAHTLPEPSITVADTTGFLSAGALTIGTQIVEYEAISGNTFLGCRGGDGTLSDGATVAQRGGIRYDWIAADVDTVGDLDAWWRVTLPSTKVQESPIFDIEIADPLVVFRGLCEVADVASYAPGYRPNAETEELLERLILAETRSIQRETGREFVSFSPALGTRRFDIDGWNAFNRKVYIGDLAQAPDTVRIVDIDQTTVLETVASTDYILLPRNRDGWQPITAIFFPWATANAATLQAGYVLEVVLSGTNVWGFPSIPDDIREACAKLVVARYALDAANAGTLLAESLAEVNVGALFASGRSVVESYMLPLVA